MCSLPLPCQFSGISTSNALNHPSYLFQLLVNEGSRGRAGEQLNYLFDLRNDPTETKNVISSNIAVAKVSFGLLGGTFRVGNNRTLNTPCNLLGHQGLASLLWETYYPRMVPSEWAAPDSGAYQVWDTQEAFVGPWEASPQGSTNTPGMSAARASYESALATAKTE